jgi:DNA-binding beta-propeller fold protein YncE
MGVAYDLSNGYIYVTNEGSNTVSVISTGKLMPSVVPTLVVVAVVVVLIVALLMIKRRKP